MQCPWDLFAARAPFGIPPSNLSHPAWSDHTRSSETMHRIAWKRNNASSESSRLDSTRTLTPKLFLGLVYSSKHAKTCQNLGALVIIPLPLVPLVPMMTSWSTEGTTLVPSQWMWHSLESLPCSGVYKAQQATCFKHVWAISPTTNWYDVVWISKGSWFKLHGCLFLTTILS